MRTLSVLLSLSLVACGGTDKADTGAGATDTSTSTGTGTVETTFPLTNAGQVEEAFQMATLPSGLYLMTMVTAMASSDPGTDPGATVMPCPAVEQADGGTTITGGCTADDGTEYTGSVVITLTAAGGRVTYDNWGWTGADLLNVDGTHAVGTDMSISTEEAGDGLRVTGRDRSGMNLSVSYTSFNQLVPFLTGEPGNYPIQAAYSAVGLTGSGAATLEGSYTYTAECEDGPANGSFTLMGAQRVTLSVASCATNDCIHWEAADGATGDLCDEAPPADTGTN
jgi:hypothetical protein